MQDDSVMATPGCAVEEVWMLVEVFKTVLLYIFSMLMMGDKPMYWSG
jgi:hypothetical protein